MLNGIDKTTLLSLNMETVRDVPNIMTLQIVSVVSSANIISNLVIVEVKH